MRVDLGVSRLSSLAVAGLGALLTPLLGCLDRGDVVVPNPFDAGGFVSGGATPVAGSGLGGSAGAGGGTGVEPILPLGGAPSTIAGDITEVAKSAGCGTPAVSGGKVTLQTMGTKAADCANKLDGVPRCGTWSVPRDYYVNLPTNYDLDKAYPLVIEAPGCGGNGINIYPLPGLDAIRVGITPGPNSTGHATNENQRCFDTDGGDDSIDFVFYENLYDQLNQALCFDRNRVFVSGFTSGARLSDELGCKYAGDPLRPVRAVLPDSGGLPTNPAFLPTCTSAPMAGMWIHELPDTIHPFADTKVAIARAMSVNHCTHGDSYDNATFDDFPIGGGNPDSACQLILGCDPLYPLVVCSVLENGHGDHSSIGNPGFGVFIKQFGVGHLLTGTPGL